MNIDNAASRVSQSIRVGGMFLAVLDASPHHDGLMITRVNGPRSQRRKGFGARMIKETCRQADNLELTLYLEVAPYDDGGMDAEQLNAWYASYGFEDFGLYTMRRIPH